jgi:pseudo-response regulator 1
MDFSCFTVTSVKSARQVIDALNAEGQYIDIILAEVDLPTKKGMKMLKYIARDKELRRIHIISKLWFFFLSQGTL